MANFEDLDKEKLAEAERLLRGKVNTLGKDEPVFNESFGRSSYSLLDNTMIHTPSAQSGLIPPNYDDFPTVAGIATRYVEVRLHSYLPSGLTGKDSVQTFMTISGAPNSHNTTDIEAVRIKNLVSPAFSQGKANAAHPDPNFRGFELALYPAKSNGGVGNALVADTTNPISPIADPTAGPPAGIGTTGNWVVDYDNGIVRFSHPPLNGSDGAMNPNNVYGDIEGAETADGYGAITMFATFYQYTGEFGTTNMNVVTVGDGYVSEGTFTGQNHDTVQSAINSISTVGGTVFIKGGSYDFVKKVTVPAGIKIYGMGGVTITRPPTEPAFLINDGYCTIEGVNIVNRTDDLVSERGAIEIGTTSETTISDIVIKNNTIESIYYAPGNRYLPAIRFASDFNCTIENLKIQDNVFITSSDQHDTVHIWGGEAALGTYVALYKTIISGNTYKALGSAQFVEAVFFESHSTLNNFTFSNNRAESDRDGIVPAGFITVDAVTNNLTITNNNIGYIDLVRSISDLVINNNNISSYIEIIGITGGLVSNNKIKQYVPDVASIYISTCTNTIVEGNVFDANIWISSNAQLNNVSISNNVLREFFIDTGVVALNTNFSLNKTRALGEGNILESTGSLYVAIGAAGSLATSPDGITWTQQTSSFGSTDIFALAYNGKDLWVAGGDLGKIATSPDGITWTQRTSNFSGSDSIASIDYNGKDLWVAVGTSGTITTSPDGITWTPQTSSFGSTTIFGVAHNKKDLWVAVGVSGKLATSPDGINWTQQTSSFGATAIYNIAHNGKDLWIATGVSGSGKIATSPNGFEWTQRTSSFGAVNINDVAYNGKDLWVAVSTGGHLATSPDGITWTQQVSSFGTEDISSVVYNGKNLWVAVGGTTSGLIATSPDGVAWTQQTSGFGTNLVFVVDSLHNSNAGVLARGSDYNGTGVQGIGGGNAGVGVEGYGGDGYGAGVKGIGGKSGATGVEGHGGGPDGYGVLGVGSAGLGDGLTGGIGVYGVGFSTKPGVQGIGGTSSGPGVYGISNSTTAVAVVGTSVSLDVPSAYIAGWNGAGVAGISAEAGRYGVGGEYANTSTYGEGVQGFNGANGAGVGGYSSDTTGNFSMGVIGQIRANVSGGAGVVGAKGPSGFTFAQNNTDFAGAGVFGYSVETAGVKGVGAATGVAGVLGVGTVGNSNGVQGTGFGDGYGVGGFGGATGPGVYGESGTSGLAGVIGQGAGGDAYGVIGIGGVDNGIGVWGRGQGKNPGILATGGSNSGDGINSYAGDGQLMVAVGQSGKTATSTDGVNWTQQTSIFGSNAITAVAYGNGLWVAMGYQDLGIVFPALVATSLDGINWTQGTFADTTFQLPSSIYYNDKDLWVAGSDVGGAFAISSDGINWRPVGVAANIMSDVVYTKSFWISTHNNVPSGVMISPDGVNWTIYSITGSGSLNGVGYDGENLLIIVGTGGYLATSPDGVNWEVRTSSFGGTDIHAVAHNGKDLWIAVGASGKLATSPDGINWTQQTSSFSSTSITDIIYNGKDLWIAIAASGKIATSPNGTDWTQQTSSFDSTNIESIAIRYGTGSGIIAHGSQYNGTGIISHGHGNLGIGVIGYGGDGYGIGIKGIGGLSGGNGVEGHGGFDGYGVLGVGGASSGSGNSYGSGVIGIGSGDRAGVIGLGGDTGYGVVAKADMTSPVRSAFRIVPQDSNPTVGEVGDLYVKTSDQKLYICTSAGYPGGPTPTWAVVGSQA